MAVLERFLAAIDRGEFNVSTQDTKKPPEGGFSVLVERVRTNWNHLVNDVSEWSEVLEIAFPASGDRVTH